MPVLGRLSRRIVWPGPKTALPVPTFATWSVQAQALPTVVAPLTSFVLRTVRSGVPWATMYVAPPVANGTPDASTEL